MTKEFNFKIDELLYMKKYPKNLYYRGRYKFAKKKGKYLLLAQENHFHIQIKLLINLQMNYQKGKL